MNRGTFRIKATTAPGSQFIELHPDFGYTETNEKARTFQRSIGGQLNVFSHVGSSQRFSLPLEFVTSSDVSLINSWWITQTLVNFEILPRGDFFILDDAILGLLDQTNNPLADDTLSFVNTMRITNINRPFPSHVPQNFGTRRGILFLITVV